MSRRRAPDWKTLGKPFILMTHPSGNRASYVVSSALFRIAEDGFLSRVAEPENSPAGTCSKNLDGAPPQQYILPQSAYQPRFRGIAGDIRVMNSDAEKLGHALTHQTFLSCA